MAEALTEEAEEDSAKESKENIAEAAITGLLIREEKEVMVTEETGKIQKKGQDILEAEDFRAIQEEEISGGDTNVLQKMHQIKGKSEHEDKSG